MSRKVSITVGNKQFESILAAAKHYNVHSLIIYNALVKGEKFNGLTVKSIDSNYTPKTHKPYKINKDVVKAEIKHETKACPVVCETTGKTYKTITEAAKAINVNAWTMSIKMTSAGRFVDKEGNIYKRVKPMNSKNVYKSPDHMTRSVVGGFLRHAKQANTVTVSNPVAAPVQEQSADLCKLLRDKAISCISNNNLKDARAILDIIDIVK